MKAYLHSKLLLFKDLLREKGTIITDTDIKQYEVIKKIQREKKIKNFYHWI